MTGICNILRGQSQLSHDVEACSAPFQAVCRATLDAKHVWTPHLIARLRAHSERKIQAEIVLYARMDGSLQRAG